MSGTTTVRGIDVRERSPWGVFALVLLTFGLYYVVWYYRVNDELRRFGEATGVGPNPLRVRPIVSVLAVTLGGFLIVPAVISPYRTATRIRRAQELAGTEQRLNPVVALLLYLCGLMLIPVECVYAQRHLNSVWAHERAEAEKAALGMRGPIAAAAVPTPAPLPRRRSLVVNLAAVVVAAAVIAGAFAIAISTAEGGPFFPSSDRSEDVLTERDMAVTQFDGIVQGVRWHRERTGGYEGLSLRALRMEGWPVVFRHVTRTTFCIETDLGVRRWSVRDERLETLAARPC